jgi:steroid 5-alpha reductase family enzyme
MDGARYYLALLLLVVTPGVFLNGFSIHPFIRFWRRLGLGLTYLIHSAFMVIVAVGLFLLRESLLSVQFGTSLALIVLAIPIYSVGVIVSRQRREQLGMKVLMGLPELAPEKYPTRLVTEGIYSRIRHPRYVELLLFLLAYTLVVNYLATYILFLLSLVLIALVVQLEERELRDRFGEEYKRYCERVPRFIPKF